MGKLIQVPYIKQPKKSAKCGAACAAMIIKYYTGSTPPLDDIWSNISAISPELNREYCRSFKIGAYIARNYFGCSSVRYSSLREFLEFCNANDIAPMINHKSFENNIAGHFSVVKNICGDFVILNDPENKKRADVSLVELEAMASKISETDEIGGNTAIVPALDKFPYQTRFCPNCGADIDMSFSYAANARSRIVEKDLCQNCDVFSPTP